MLQRYCAQCKNESSRTTSVKCVNLRTFWRISWGIVWGIVYFKFYPRGFSFSTFDYQYLKLLTTFNGKYKLLEPKKCPHNPEVVGSSPASATIKIPGIHYEYRGFSNFFAWFEMAHFSVLGQFWANGPEFFHFGPPSGSSGRIFYAFFLSSTSAIHSEALALFSSMMWL